MNDNLSERSTKKQSQINYSTLLCAITIPFMVAALYSLGKAYSSGYYSEFGVNDGFTLQSVDQVLLNGFNSLATTYYVIAFLVFYLAGLIIFLFGFHFLSRTPLARKIKAKMATKTNQTVKPVETYHSFFIPQILLLAKIMGVLIAIYYVVFLGAIFENVFYQNGKKVAMKDKSIYDNTYLLWKTKAILNDTLFVSIHPTISHLGKTLNGFVISANATFVAFYSPSTQKGKIYPANSFYIDQKLVAE